MEQLSLTPLTVSPWFAVQEHADYQRVTVTPQTAAAWLIELGLPFRRSYISDQLLEASVTERTTKRQALDSKLPDPGSVMAGDFGEILVYLFQGSRAHAAQPIGVLRWRLKQDRRKTAPYSDVVQFVLPAWPAASNNDALVCSEVKVKATNSNRHPLTDAIEGAAKDKTSRLAGTLAWLQDCARTPVMGTMGAITLDHLDRFVNAAEHPRFARHFFAVAVVDDDFVDDEIAVVPAGGHEDCSLVVISVPDLRTTYTAVFEAARATCDPPPPQGDGH